MEVLDWLEDAKQFLSKPEVEFIISVCSKLKQQKVQSVNNPSAVRIGEIKAIAVKLKKDFKIVVKKLKEGSASREEYLRIYPEWNYIRECSIKQLRDIADDIQKRKQESQEVALGSSVVSVVGGAVALLVPGGTVLRFLGKALVGFGVVVAAASSADREISLENNISEAKRIMQLDEKNLEKLIDWLVDGNTLHEAENNINFIRSIEELEMRANNLKELSKSCSKMVDEIDKQLKSIKFPPKLRNDIRDILGILISFFMIRDRFAQRFSEAGKCAIAMGKLRILSNLLFSVVSVGHSVKRCYDLKSAQRSEIGIGILFDIFNIILTLEQDPKSVEAEKIREVAKEMEEEAKIFKKII